MTSLSHAYQFSSHLTTSMASGGAMRLVLFYLRCLRLSSFCHISIYTSLVIYPLVLLISVLQIYVEIHFTVKNNTGGAHGWLIQENMRLLIAGL